MHDAVMQDIGDGTKGSKKRRQQHRHVAVTTIGGDGGINKQAGSSGVVRTTAIMSSGKRQVRLPTDHFERLLEETCLNHAYPIKHKLRDCGVMKNIMAPRSLARGMEVDDVPDEGSMTPLPGEDAVMTIYDERPSSAMCRVSILSLGTPARCSWGCKNVRI
jgi:hypothetical protein